MGDNHVICRRLHHDHHLNQQNTKKHRIGHVVILHRLYLIECTITTHRLRDRKKLEQKLHTKE